MTPEQSARELLKTAETQIPSAADRLIRTAQVHALLAIAAGLNHLAEATTRSGGVR